MATLAVPAPPAPVERPTAMLNRRVVGLFKDPNNPSGPARSCVGKVISVQMGVPGHGTLWRVVYEDEDEEELSRGELQEALLEPVYIKEEDGPLEVKRVKREPQEGAVGAGG